MKFVLMLALALTLATPALAAKPAKKKQEAKETQAVELTEQEKRLAAEGLKLLAEDEKRPNKKPLPKNLRDKMQSSVPVEGEKKN